MSGSEFGEVLVPVPVPVPVPAPDPDNIFNILHIFPKTKKSHKNLAFTMSEAAYFPESWLLTFYFLTFLLHFLLDPDPNPVPGPKP
jgi:hypothetical protein